MWSEKPWALLTPSASEVTHLLALPLCLILSSRPQVRAQPGSWPLLIKTSFVVLMAHARPRAIALLCPS